MPTSKKRVKKETPEVEVAMKNPLHSTWGKAVVIALAVAFVAGTVATLIVAMVQAVK